MRNVLSSIYVHSFFFDFVFNLTMSSLFRHKVLKDKWHLIFVKCISCVCVQHAHTNHQTESLISSECLFDRELTHIKSKNHNTCSKWHANNHINEKLCLLFFLLLFFLLLFFVLICVGVGRCSIRDIHFVLQRMLKLVMRQNEKWDSFAFYKTISRVKFDTDDGSQWRRKLKWIENGRRKKNVSKNLHLEIVCQMSSWQWFRIDVWSINAHLRVVRLQCEISSIKLMLSVPFCCASQQQQ